MWAYVLRRLLTGAVILWSVSVAVFLVVHLVPGDPAQLLAGEDAHPEDVERFRRQLGLDRPLHEQYLRFLSGVLRGDFGTSFRTGRPVQQEVGLRMPHTIELAVASMAWAVPAGIAVGVYAAVRANSVVDTAVMASSLVGVSAPSFVIGLLLMLLFAYDLGWLPASGRGGPPWTAEGLRTLVMPALTLGAAPAAVLARLTRSTMLEVLGQDFVRTARAKGLSERVVLYRHALRNALIPIVTLVGLQLGALLGGAVIAEQVFAWPGVGTLLVNAIYARDYPTVQATVLLIACIFVLINLLVDLSYALLDPRIEYR